MIVPITRKEKLLNAIATNGNVDFVPKTREELFLFKILGADVNTPTPITRKELLYQHIIDGTIPTFEPRTRLEKFIMVAAGAELELPVVLTREEYWWAEISDSAYETITGAIVHFISKKARAIKSLIAKISYTQDLNGYDSPWPAGGGKNLLNYDVWKTVAISHGDAVWENNGVTLTATDNDCYTQYNNAYYPSGARIPITQGETITVSWEETENAPGIVYIFPNGNIGGNVSINNNRAKQLSYTAGSGVTYVTLRFGVTTSGVTIAYKNIQVVKGTTIPTWSPYSNICPISGWTGCNVTRTGKNLFDGTFIANTMIVDSTGEYYANEYHKCSNQILAKENTAYTLSGTDLHKRTGTATNAANVTIAYYKADGTYIRREAPDTSTNTYKTVTTPANTAFVIFQVGGQATNVMLEESATETTYEPYQGNTYNVAFPAVGKNLFNAFDAQPSTTNGVTYYRTNGVYHLSGTNTKTDATWVLDARRTDLPKFEIGKTYTMSVSGNIPSNIFIQLSGVNAQTGSQYTMGTVQSTSTQVSFTVDDRYSSTAQLFVGILRTATNVDGEFSIQIEEGSTATAYEPYTTTVYGGTLDVVSGLLTVTDECTTTIWGAMYNPVDRGNGIQSRTLDLPYLPKNRDGTKGNSNTNITAQYAYSTSGNIHFYLRSSNNVGRVNLFLPSSTTADTPIQIFYELATPRTYQLTPTEVTTLLGDNTIWADTGDVTVTY